MRNPALPKLLRAIANGTQAQENRHDIIFNAAADELERLEAALKEAALKRYHYAVAYAMDQDWNGVPEIRKLFEWAHSQDGLELSANELAVIGQQFLLFQAGEDEIRRHNAEIDSDEWVPD